MSPRGDREEYLSLVIHELKNPLVGIDAAARVLSSELGAHPSARRASLIASEARHLLGVLDTVADADAAAAGRLRSVFAPTDLAALVRETIAGTHLGGHTVTASGADAPVMVEADPGRIRQVLRNLLANAAQYSPPGSPIDIAVAADPRRRTVTVSVRDHGPGIGPAERPRLFTKFARLSTAEGTRGTGLGLYICKRILEDHGGTMRYEHSEKTFSFALPLARTTAQASGSTPARADARSRGVRGPARASGAERARYPRPPKQRVGQARDPRERASARTRTPRGNVASARARGASPARTLAKTR